jgi:hypothetical protein
VFRVDGGHGGETFGTVTIGVANNDPSPMPDSVSVHGWSNNTTTETSVSDNVLSGSGDSDGDPLIASLYSNPSHGSVTVDENGDYTYKPAQGYVGSDSFEFQVDDGLGGLSGCPIRGDWGG